MNRGLLASILALTACAGPVRGGADPLDPGHGLVGLRPIPADEAGTKHNHGGSWEGMPAFDAQKGRDRSPGLSPRQRRCPPGGTGVPIRRRGGPREGNRATAEVPQKWTDAATPRHARGGR